MGEAKRRAAYRASMEAFAKTVADMRASDKAKRSEAAKRAAATRKRNQAAAVNKEIDTNVAFFTGLVA